MKKRITIRVDEDILAWFRGRGKGYQSHINKALRFYVDNFTKDRVVSISSGLSGRRLGKTEVKEWSGGYSKSQQLGKK